MITRTFTWKTARITVREPVGWDQMDGLHLYRHLYSLGIPTEDTAGAIEYNRREIFINAVLRSTIEGDLDFPWVAPDSTTQEFCVAYEAFGQQPVTLVQTWVAALTETANGIGDPELAPPETLTDAKKKTPASPPNEAPSEKALTAPSPTES